MSPAAEADPLGTLDQRLEETRAMVEAARQEGDYRAFVTLTKAEADLRAQRAALLPPPPPDPEADPMFVDARKRLMAQRRRLRLRRLKEAAQLRDAMCSGCRRLFEGLFDGDLDGAIERAGGKS